MKTKRVNLLNLAQKIHNYAMENRIYSITTWWAFSEIQDEWGFKETDSQLYRAIRRGQKCGLFSKGYWMGTGMTPWSGSARRVRYYDILVKNPSPDRPFFISRIEYEKKST